MEQKEHHTHDDRRVGDIEDRPGTRAELVDEPSGQGGPLRIDSNEICDLLVEDPIDSIPDRASEDQSQRPGLVAVVIRKLPQRLENYQCGKDGEDRKKSQK